VHLAPHYTYLVICTIGIDLCRKLLTIQIDATDNNSVLTIVSYTLLCVVRLNVALPVMFH
jgi:hypothetical protein